MKKSILTDSNETPTRTTSSRDSSYEASLVLTHQGKIMIPPTITKGDIITYYKNIASLMIPYMRNHPLMIHRFPNGITGTSFYQKNAPPSAPPWIQKVDVPTKEAHTTYIICQNRATLIYLANLNCITPHLWLSRFTNLHAPDRLIIDLDPSDNSFNKVRTVALLFKELFDTLKLTSFVMTTGSRGLHVIVPLGRTADFTEVKAFALRCSSHIKDYRPDLVTLEVRTDKRGTQVFIDTARNNFAATAVAPYAVRAYTKGPVATPLYWYELEEDAIQSSQFCTMQTIFKRIEGQEDPW
ncbi:ATP-dependent DNA ligase, partial [Candidatus Dependentiae bacterium]|nr:ATP-dependent DNA ligase [Candidatus Dependentiae bacterium]